MIGILAAAALLTPTPTLALQMPAPAPQTAADAAQQLILPGAARALDCGPRPQLARMAFCVTAPINAIGALADAYIVRLGEMGWLQADGRENLVVFVRRREGGGCDGVQMLAFYDEDQPVEDASPGYLAFALIPGDVCAAPEATPVPGTPPQ